VSGVLLALLVVSLLVNGALLYREWTKWTYKRRNQKPNKKSWR
jgi:hypothetical protein